MIAGSLIDCVKVTCFLDSSCFAIRILEIVRPGSREPGSSGIDFYLKRLGSRFVNLGFGFLISFACS